MLIPTIGTKGIWSLGTPFDTMLLPNTPYALISVRKLNDVLAAGEDPVANYYTGVGLSDVEYTADLASDAVILTLQSDSGDVIYVPSTYMLSFPDIGGVEYTVMLAAVDLGAVPNNYDFTYLQTRMAQVVQQTLGVNNPVVDLVAVSETTILPSSDAKTVEAARVATIKSTPTDHARLIEVTAQRDRLVQLVQNYQQYILANRAKLGI